jgi:hypothetical protein
VKQTEIDINTLTQILQNPIVLGALIGLIRNIGGYIYNCFEAKKLLQYNGMQLLETLALWETFFLALSGVAGLPTSTTVTLTTIIDIIRTVRKAITSNQTTKTTP